MLAEIFILCLEAAARAANEAPPPARLFVSAVRSMSASLVRRDKAALSSGCESHPANAPAGSNRSSYGGNEVAEAFG